MAGFIKQQAFRIGAWCVLIALLVGANLIGNLSAYVYLLILLGLWPLLLTEKRLRVAMWRWESGAYLLAFLFLAIAFVASAQAPSDLENLGNFLPFLLFIPAIALFTGQSRSNGVTVIGFLALLGAIVSLTVALYEVQVLGMRRAQGFINLTNPFAMASIMLGFLALIGFLGGTSLWRMLFFLGPVAGGAAALLAGTRAAVVMFAVLSVILAVFWASRLDNRRRIILASAALFVGLLVVVAGVLFESQFRALGALDTITTFLGGGEAVDRSTEIRLNLYYGGMRAFLDAPIFGHGWWEHVEVARNYMEPSVADEVERWSHLHNDYINFAALAGVFGLVAFALYLLIPVVGTWKSSRDKQFLARFYGALTLSASYAVFGLFDTSFGAEMLLCFGPVFSAVLLGFMKDDFSGQSSIVQV